MIHPILKKKSIMLLNRATAFAQKTRVFLTFPEGENKRYSQTLVEFSQESAKNQIPA